MVTVSNVQGISLEYITDMVIQICKSDDEEEIKNYLFEIFSKNSLYVKKQAIIDFNEVFGFPKNSFGTVSKLSNDAFHKGLDGKKVNFAVLREARPMMTAMFALIPASDKEEKYAILSALHGNKNLDSYIYEHLPEEKEFFIIEKAFWD